MKLKSLLLGSAAALALSTGAQAADPIAEFVSLDVCDAYGISGLTIASDDTCLLITGEVEYDYWYETVFFDDDSASDRTSTIDWFLTFEATTQTDAGRAIASVTIGQEDQDDTDTVIFEEAFVSFGDTTVLTAGYTGSLFGVDDAQHILDDVATTGDPDDSHVIQVVSDLGNGWSIGAGLEALSDQADYGDLGGRAGVVVGYDDGTTVANVGAYIYDLYNMIDNDADALFDVYADVSTSFDIFDVYAALTVDQDGNIQGLVTGEVALDIATIRAGVGGVYANAADEFTPTAGAGVTFALTDTVDLDLEVVYNAENGKIEDYFNQLALGTVEDVVWGTLTLSSAFTDTLTGEAWATVGYNTDTEDSVYGGGVGVTYEPGGDFEANGTVAVLYDAQTENTGLGVHFGAVKSF
ncbi:porin [Pelagibacterium xiamenense]|uniref:porin n=1 Tax=Pelagibacterium xiamenense TaxID=2901140 RepID=UPI001E4AA775|nr:porin [Pelagibacterium xiamenense]MCD7060761.1 porin [Pelagibacterium xiamenense]